MPSKRRSVSDPSEQGGTLAVIRDQAMSETADTQACALLERVPGLRRRADLDLLMFFARHPRTLMGSEQLAKFLGYDIGGIARSLDVLMEAGLLRRAQNPQRAPRMYEFVPGATCDWLPAFFEFASTREGRLALRRALPGSAAARTNDRPEHARNTATSKSSRPFLVRRNEEPGTAEAGRHRETESRQDEPEGGTR